MGKIGFIHRGFGISYPIFLINYNLNFFSLTPCKKQSMPKFTKKSTRSEVKSIGLKFYECMS